jgi:hypothetical protein
VWKARGAALGRRRQGLAASQVSAQFVEQPTDAPNTRVGSTLSERVGSTLSKRIGSTQGVRLG